MGNIRWQVNPKKDVLLAKCSMFAQQMQENKSCSDTSQDLVMDPEQFVHNNKRISHTSNSLKTEIVRKLERFCNMNKLFTVIQGGK